MASNSKRAVALVLTAMMAASALAGCGGSSSGSTASTGGGATTASTDTSTDASASADAVDLDSEEIQKQIKDAIAQEAEATGGKISMKLWCSGDDLQFEKTLIKEFKDKYADSRYENRCNR